MPSSATVARPSSKGRIALLGVPIEAGAGRRGAVMGPAALRTARIAETLDELEFTVEDHGDIVPDPLFAGDVKIEGNARNPELIAGFSRATSRRAYELMKSGAIPVFMGGDHAMSMGTVNGVSRFAKEQGRELFVLWLDAHADFNTPESSPSGNMHGMPVAMLCGEAGLDTVMGDEVRAPIDPRNVLLVGIRQIDHGERKAVEARGIDVADMRKVDEFGVAAIIREFMEKVSHRNGMLHVSLDVDFLDPTIAPGVGTTVDGGVNYREAHLIMEMLHDSGLVTSVDLAELNPFLDDRGRSAKLLVELTASIFGRQILARTTR